MSLYELHADLLGGKPDTKAAGARITRGEMKLFGFLLLFLLSMAITMMVYNEIQHLHLKREIHNTIKTQIIEYNKNYDQFLKISLILNADKIRFDAPYSSTEEIKKESKSIKTLDDEYIFLNKLQRESSDIANFNERAQEKIDQYNQDKAQQAKIIAQEKEMEREEAQTEAADKAQWQKQQQENAARQQSHSQTNSQAQTSTNPSPPRHQLINSLFSH
ncbi:MAG: hypothetical protein K2Q14_05895 [Gammaproteobacteria bacterium]|nr:hypothetical protein [Gammaproteobacteria bacterium]